MFRSTLDTLGAPLRYSMILLIRGYQYFLSPWLGHQCRFVPTCSHYAIEAIEKYGAIQGAWLTLKRLVRCQPFCAGGEDRVP